MSYAWEDQAPDQSILCNSHELLITRNVFGLLNYMAEASPGAYLWIDAVCIDQKNDIEKAAQVRMMGEIYANAWKTVGWLGFGNEIEIERPMGGVYEMAEKLEDFDFSRDRGFISKRELEEVGFSKARSYFWSGLQKLLLRPWFRRLWVVQEFILSKELGITVGKTSINPMLLVPLINQYSLFNSARLIGLICINEDFETAVSCSNICLVLGERRLAGIFHQLELPELIPYLGQFLVSDPRDRIYGGLGIVNSFWRENLDISYETSVVDLYLRVARCWLVTNPNLSRLNVASSRLLFDGLPSWCPNFNAQPEAYILGRGTLYNASNSHPTDHRADSNKSVQLLQQLRQWLSSETIPPKHLAVSGFCIDTLKTIIPLRPTSYSSPISSFLTWEAKWSKLSQGTSKAPRAHARALVANLAFSKAKSVIPYPGNVLEDYEDAVQWLQDRNDCIPFNSVRYLRATAYASKALSYFSTQKGRIGTGPAKCQLGDVAYIFDRAITPLILFDLRNPARMGLSWLGRRILMVLCMAR